MSMSPQAVQFLLRLLSRRAGGSPASGRAAVAGLAKGKKPSDMARMRDRKSAGRKGRRNPQLYDGDDYPMGYRGPDPGDINELQELQAIIEALGLSGKNRIKNAGQASRGKFQKNPFRSQYRGDHNAMSPDSSLLNQFINDVPEDIDIRDLLRLIRGE